MQSMRRPQGMVAPSSIYNGYSAGWTWVLSSTTWRHPNPGQPLTLIIVGIGGGASGGGGESANSGGGGGGGSGRVSFTELLNVTTDQPIVIAAAAASVGTATDGNAGGTATFGSLISLTGGSAGLKGNAGVGGAGGAGGAGGGGGSGNNAGGKGGQGLDLWGGGAGSSPNAGSPPPGRGAAGPWVSSSQPMTTTDTAGTGGIPGGWPNGASCTSVAGTSSNNAGGGGGDATLTFPMLMGRGAGGNGGDLSTSASNGASVTSSPGIAGCFAIMIRPF